MLRVDPAPAKMAQVVEEKPGPGVSMGTSIIAAAFEGGVVMAADSRTSVSGYVSNRVSNKLSHVHDRIYCCRSGSAADTQAIAGYVKYFLEQHHQEMGEAPLVKVAASVFKKLCYENRDALMASIICAGWDKRDGGSVYSIPLGGVCVKQPFALGGSGSTYIYGHVDSIFREGMTKEECKAFCVKALSLAMARDGSSGGIIRMLVIDESGVERSMIPGDRLPTAWEAMVHCAVFFMGRQHVFLMNSPFLEEMTRLLHPKTEKLTQCTKYIAYSKWMEVMAEDAAAKPL